MARDQDKQQAVTPDARPVSATSSAVNLASYGLGGVVLIGASEFSVEPLWACFAALAAIALPIMLYDLLVARVQDRESAGLGAQNPPDTGRVAVKLFAFFVTVAVVAGIYYFLPFYGRRRFETFLEVGLYVLPIVLILSIPYFFYIDRRQKNPRDGSWEMGQLLMGRVAGRDWAVIKTYVLGWAIKAFFLPIMAGPFLSVGSGLAASGVDFYLRSQVQVYFLIFQIVLFLDLAVAVLGYMLTLRIFDSHIRSVNPLAWGWVVTIACYYPFWSLGIGNWFSYGDGNNWVDWLGGDMTLLLIWGAVLSGLKITWLWANASFGLRFSNLTHRGILTGGPFRFSKHPSYLSKNLAWWLISMPFLTAAGWEVAALNCLSLLAINTVYFLRARAEEKHLSEDPTYVAYALWMNDHGLLAWPSRLMPWLRYKAPSGALTAIDGLPPGVAQAAGWLSSRRK